MQTDTTIEQESMYARLVVIESDDCVHVAQKGGFVIVGKEDIAKLIEVLQKFTSK
jgi:hypothetical protein